MQKRKTMATEMPPTPTSDTTPKVAPVVIKEAPPLVTTPISVHKNGVDLLFGSSKKTRGKDTGEQFIEPLPVTNEEVHKLYQFIGPDAVLSIVNDYLRTQSMSLTDSCFTKDDKGVNVEGTFDAGKFARLFPAIISTTETNKQLEERAKGLVDKATSLMESADSPEGFAKCKALLTQVKELREIINARKEVA
jgi:hypothetical protein